MNGTSSISKKILALCGFLFLVLLIEYGGHYFTMSSVGDWYQTLKKPSWNPPSWVFGVAWTILYIMIAISGWLIFIKVRSSTARGAAFVFYGFQLFCNFLWTYFFFFLKNPALGLLDIFVLLILIGKNIVDFAKLNKIAAALLIPYFFWTLYASSLNLAIWILNQ